MKRIALIPAYEPTSELTSLLEELRRYDFETVLVNDGSSDACRAVFSQAARASCVLQYAINQGKGFALKTGLEFIRDNYQKDSIIVTMDADGQHLLKDAARICEAACQNQGALILGSRHFAEGVPLRSRTGNRITSALF
ncbi:MAG: glycosyltransferase family 2 protein [Lachnospiraceae bacterium]|nr:glycosyltransferase family 2 protein [Lachnospiraceae bacterium]MCH4030831.1 glycosyltransferase family 2 protein [Lachnospiraceae bacterium]MCH4070804.1 glycosyltransferase family 2 protein [Lachnospiraceae bacterium]MCH4107021.1 glycosyltransferase family 2 protein [Lachnospiraceae bacterium]MCI1302124.1 glycosyltransferase family 2 protein [Lachnospiraceae bacterium]